MPTAFIYNPPSALPQHQSRIPGTYCNAIECLVEGLRDLEWEVFAQHENPLGVEVARAPNDCDLYLVQRHPNLHGARVFESLVQWHVMPRTAFIDGMDARFGLDWHWAASDAQYFRSANRAEWEVRTLPFAILDRYLVETRPTPQDTVFFVCRQSNHADRGALRAELERGRWNCEFGPLFDGNGTAAGERRRGNRRYYARLNECKVAINAPGGSPDCYRYWEIAASHAVLVSHAVEEMIPGFPDPPTPGVHYIAYRSVDEINDAVSEAMRRYNEIHEAQRAFFLTHHRGRNRALSVLRFIERLAMVERRNAGDFATRSSMDVSA